jgi:hypothetical protein
MLNNLILGYSSKKIKERTLTASIAAWWQLIMLIAIVCIPDGTNKWAKWAILTLFVGYPYCHPILVSMNSMVCARHLLSFRIHILTSVCVSRTPDPYERELLRVLSTTSLSRLPV